MDILDYLIDEDKSGYKCYDVIKKLIQNGEFEHIVKEGITKGEISKFSPELWDKIRSQNIRRINSFEDVFKDGANIGYCTVAAKQLSYSLDDCFLCGGILPILIGTFNCPDGSHTWISYQGHIIDTTLMMVINEKYASTIGYIEESRVNPNTDPIYVATKEFTNDPNLKNGNKVSR